MLRRRSLLLDSSYIFAVWPGIDANKIYKILIASKGTSSTPSLPKEGPFYSQSCAIDSHSDTIQETSC